MQNAEVTAVVSNGEVVEIQSLTINNAGTLDGQQAQVGEVTVNADNVELKNLVVKNDVIVTENVVTALNVDNVTMNQLITPDTREVQQTEKPATRLKITFKDSTVVYMEIKKVDTLLSVHGATQIGILAVESNSSIWTDPDVILPKLKIYKGVTQIELNASIGQVEIETNDDIEVTGKGNFDEVQVKTDKSVTLKTEGTIKSLSSDAQNITLGTSVVVNKTVDSNNVEKPAEEMVQNYEEVKDNIKPANPTNPDEGDSEYIAAKTIPVEGKFGYATLSVMNAEGKNVYYRFAPYGTEATIGSSVPADAIKYNTGDEFINWAALDLEVYVVDAENKITDSYVIDYFSAMNRRPIQVEYKNGKVHVLTHLENKGVEFGSFFVIHNGQYFYPENVSNYKFKTDSQTGLQSVEIDLPSDFVVDSSKNMQVYHHLQSPNSGILSNDTLIEGDGELQSNIGALLYLQELSLEAFTPEMYYFESILRKYSFTPEPVYDDAGNLLYNKYESVFVPFLLEKYLAAIKTTTINSDEQFTQLLINVNEENSDLIKQYEAVSSQVSALFVEDYYDYDTHERLAATTTAATIEAARKVVNALNLPTESSFKKQLLSDVDYAKYLLDELTKLFTLQQAAVQFTNSQSSSDGYNVANVLNRYANAQYKVAVFEKYVEQLTKQQITSVVQLQQLLAEVNEQNPDLVAKQQQYNELVADTFVGNTHDTDVFERLKEGKDAAVQYEKFIALQRSLTPKSWLGNEIEWNLNELLSLQALKETIANNHTLAKQYIEEHDYNAKNNLDSLLSAMYRNDYSSTYNRGLLDFYIEELAANSYVGIEQIRNAVDMTNAKYADQIAQFESFNNQLQALLKDNYYEYKSFNKLRNPETAVAQYNEIIAAIEQSSLDEGLKTQVKNEAYYVETSVLAYKVFKDIQKYTTVYVNGDFSNELYNDANNGLRYLLSEIVEYDEYYYQLFDLYVAEIQTKSQWTLDQLAEMVKQVTENNRTTLSATETVENVKPDIKLPEVQQQTETDLQPNFEHFTYSFDANSDSVSEVYTVEF